MGNRISGVPAMGDVARLARVSHQTVSRVLNGHPHVRQQTRLRVRAAIEELGYRPSEVARALVTGRSRFIGVVAHDSTLYGPASLLAAFEQAAAEAGFVVTALRADVRDRASVSRALEWHRGRQVAGIVVIAPTAPVHDAVDTVRSGTPLVMVDGDPGRSTPTVTVDQVAGAAAATRHLLDAGHRTVWHVSGPPDWFDSAGRVLGWRSALEGAGREVPPVVPAGWSAASGYRVGRELALMPDVTAVFAANDHLALGILRAMHERRRRVPRDVSVVGFDDVPEAAHFIPPLTTVRPDFDAVARDALALLLAQAGGGAAEDVPRSREPTLVPRDSVRPPAT
ncbi:LacI family DNA-binding transcriptional regulator [Saccharothrix longispora]|uniref:LacI family DNA-binding transcriptional regulator n=1 Tax=Saccharothrix longispora TaxID=33920 RepID=UPI0028FD37E8|nr:LacI family DNA-binding transcriptional regulator [Saccharothrix longispora]MDU0288225.1 LacI family DNA-binding transcriptional regulator [Saccharothrix longispora]